MNNNQIVRLCVSVVTYKGDVDVYRQTLESLSKAISDIRNQHVCGQLLVELVTIDNGVRILETPNPQSLLSKVDMSQFDELRHYVPSENLGYGKAHNIAIFLSESDYHLVLNPDVLIGEGSLTNALKFMMTHKDVGLLAPIAYDGHSKPLYLCKRYPSLLVLLLRGFAPPFIKSYFRQSMEDYEMRELYRDPLHTHEVSIASGCFMFARTDIIKNINGFSERFFLYFEDFDLSLRVSKVSKVMFNPDVKITHFGGYSAKKGHKHIAMFLTSALKFYLKNGWRLF